MPKNRSLAASTCTTNSACANNTVIEQFNTPNKCPPAARTSTSDVPNDSVFGHLAVPYHNFQHFQDISQIKSDTTSRWDNTFVGSGVLLDMEEPQTWTNFTPELQIPQEEVTSTSTSDRDVLYRSR